MLPRLKPRRFYDLVIEVAIVRIRSRATWFIPICGGASRAGAFPAPAPEHGPPDELASGAGQDAWRRCSGAGDAARHGRGGFSPTEANQLRQAMATFLSGPSIGSRG